MLFAFLQGGTRNTVTVTIILGKDPRTIERIERTMSRKSKFAEAARFDREIREDLEELGYGF